MSYISEERWSGDTTLKFVELYRNHECLWNRHLPSYKSKNDRDEAILAIVNDMGLDDFHPTDVKIKIKNLRSTYIQELCKINKSKQSGKRLYVPKMRWFPLMNSFIQSIPGRHKSLTSQEDDDEINFIGECAEDIKDYSDNSNDLMVSQPNKKCPKLGKRKFKEVSPHIQDIKYGATSHHYSPINTNQEDEFHIFGRSVEAQLKKLPLGQAISAQSEIQALLTRYRLSNIDSFENATNNSEWMD